VNCGIAVAEWIKGTRGTFTKETVVVADKDKKEIQGKAIDVCHEENGLIGHSAASADWQRVCRTHVPTITGGSEVVLFHARRLHAHAFCRRVPPSCLFRGSADSAHTGAHTEKKPPGHISLMALQFRWTTE
jgi:hypothetical protein